MVPRSFVVRKGLGPFYVLNKSAKAGLARKFLAKIADQAREKKLLSDEHSSVDGTLIDAWASIKSSHPKDDQPDPPKGRNEERDYHCKKLKNAPHASTTDPESRLYKEGKGKEA